MYHKDRNRRRHYVPEPERSFVDAFIGELIAGSVVFAVFAAIGVVIALCI
jgi:hypothetical protein